VLSTAVSRVSRSPGQGAQPRQRALQPVALRPPIAIDQGVSKRIVAVASPSEDRSNLGKTLVRAPSAALLCA